MPQKETSLIEHHSVVSVVVCCSVVGVSSGLVWVTVSCSVFCVVPVLVVGVFVVWVVVGVVEVVALLEELWLDVVAVPPLLIILCIALYVSFDNNSVETTFPFNIFVIYVWVTNPLAPFCFTTSLPAAKLESVTYFVVYGIVEIVSVLKEYVYSLSASLIPNIETVATPFLADATILTG